MSRDRTAWAEPLSASAEDGDVVVLSTEASLAVALTPEAAIKTGELLRAAGIEAQAQRRFRRKEPPARIPRPGPDDD